MTSKFEIAFLSCLSSKNLLFALQYTFHVAYIQSGISNNIIIFPKIFIDSFVSFLSLYIFNTTFLKNNCIKIIPNINNPVSFNNGNAIQTNRSSILSSFPSSLNEIYIPAKNSIANKKSMYMLVTVYPTFNAKTYTAKIIKNPFRKSFQLYFRFVKNGISNVITKNVIPTYETSSAKPPLSLHTIYSIIPANGGYTTCTPSYIWFDHSKS